MAEWQIVLVLLATWPVAFAIVVAGILMRGDQRRRKVEAERDLGDRDALTLARQRDYVLARAEAAEARLAEVEALCQRNFNLEDYYEIDANDVAAIIEGAAARGEGDRSIPERFLRGEGER